MVQGPVILFEKVFWVVLAALHFPVTNDVVSILASEAEQGYISYIDIGAHSGDTIEPIARSFKLCIAVEPDPRNVPTLARNLKGLNNCRIVEKVLQHEGNLAYLHIGRKTDASSLTQQPQLFEVIQVPSTTLDDMVETEAVVFPCLIKIDVQGNEPSVMAGGNKTLGEKCTVVSEFWPYGIKLAGYDSLGYLRLFMEKGFAVYNLRGRRLSFKILEDYIQLGEQNNLISTDLVFRKQCLGSLKA